MINGRGFVGVAILWLAWVWVGIVLGFGLIGSSSCVKQTLNDDIAFIKENSIGNINNSTGIR